MRAFVAIELPAVLRRALGQEISGLQERLGTSAIRWVSPEAVHLTLKFLGEIDDRTARSISDTLDTLCANFVRTDYRIGILGSFPNPNRPRVIWIGVQEASGELLRLQAEVERGAAELGIQPEQRPFHPHLTLGRVKREASSSEMQTLAQELQKLQIGSLGEAALAGVSLMRSELSPTGAVYTRLHYAPLKDKS